MYLVPGESSHVCDERKLDLIMQHFILYYGYLALLSPKPWEGDITSLFPWRRCCFANTSTETFGLITSGLKAQGIVRVQWIIRSMFGITGVFV